MNKEHKFVYWATAIWSIMATVVNIVGVVWFPPERVTFAMGMSAFLFCIFGHISFLIAALIIASKTQMKRWPLWLYFVHPVVAFVVFTSINWKIVSSELDADFATDK